MLRSRLNIKFYIILIFFYLYSHSQFFSQTPYFYKIDDEDGLPSSEVYQIAQDSFGYIWIGCDAGLYRYDGVKFDAFTTHKQNSKSISGIKIGKDGRSVWCQNFTGQIFKVQGDSLKLTHDITDNVYSYTQYAIDKYDNIWIANNKYIDCYNPDLKLIYRLTKLDEKKDTIIWSEIEVGDNGIIYLASQYHGIGIVDVNHGNKEIKILDTHQNIRASFEKQTGLLYALIEKNPERDYYITSIVDKKVSNAKLSYLPSDLIVYGIYRDRISRNWIYTSKGVLQIDENFKPIGQGNWLFENDKISSILQDREGNLWLSSLQNGIYVVPNFDLMLFNQTNSALNDQNISALGVNHKNQLFIGTYSGSVFKMNDDYRMESLTLFPNTPFRATKKIIEQRNGLFVSHGPLSFYHNNSNILYPLYNCRDFAWIGDTLFFITSTIFGYIPDFYNIKKDNLSKSVKIIQNRGARSLAFDEDSKTIYIASVDGLYSYHLGNLSSIKSKDGKSVFANKIQLANGKLWIATVNDGILSFNLVSKEFDEHQFYIKGNSVKALNANENYLSAVTEFGLNLVDIKSNKTWLYDYSDGITTKEINDVVYLNNNLYLASNKGLYVFKLFNPANKVKPNIKIQSFVVNNHNVPITHQAIDLNYNENTILIQYNTVCIKARGNFKYKYRLIGYDTTWYFNVSSNNQTQYFALPSGNYIFEVKAVNEDGYESEDPAIIYFTIAAPVWQKWWFYLISSLIIVLIVFLITLRVIKNIRRKSVIRNEIISSKLTAIRAQMNPHFTYNTLNSIQDLILKQDIKRTNYYLSKFSTLMRKVLEFSENETIILEDEVELIQDYLELEKLRFGDDFEFIIQVSNSLQTNSVFIPSLIIQPFVENAIKHGLLHKKGQKKLNISFNDNQEYILVIIEDNGVGRVRSAEITSKRKYIHKSFAVSATQRRIDLLNQEREKLIKLEIVDKYDSNISTGTIVKLYFPKA